MELKKALYIFQKYYPWDVRAEKVMTSLAKAGYEVRVLCRTNGENDSELRLLDHCSARSVGSGIRFPLSLPIPKNPVWKRAIEREIEEFRPDVVIPREIMLAEDAAQAAHKRGIPVVMDMAENYPSAMKNFVKYSKGFVNRLLVHRLDVPEWVEKRAVRVMDGIFVVCDEQIERLGQSFGFPESRMAVVHNTPPISFLKDPIQRESNHVITFGHHGFLSGDKRIDSLVAGFLIAAESDPDIRLLVAGGGELLEEYRAIVSKSRFADRIEFTGSYDFARLPEVLARMDVGVIPYPDTDFNRYTIHNKIFDYFAASMPVLVSDVRPLRRIVGETQAGIVGDFPSAESAARSLLGWREKFTPEMQKRARSAFAAKYNWVQDSEVLVRFVNGLLK